MSAPWIFGPVLGLLLLAASFGPAESTSSAAMATARSVLVKTASSQPSLTTGSPAPSSIATLSAAAVPFLTPLPYEADWSGGMAGWGGSDDWQTAKGLLVSDGTSYTERAGVVAPIELGSGDFAIDAEIRLDEYKGKGSMGGRASFGISARVQRNGNGYGAGHCFSLGRFVPLCAGNQQGKHRAVLWTVEPAKTLAFRQFRPGRAWHDYRLELRGNRLTLLIDDQVVLKARDNTYLQGGRVGLWSKESKISVRRFTVTEL